MKNFIYVLLLTILLINCKKSPDPVVEIEPDTTTIFSNALPGWDIVRSDLDVNAAARDFYFISDQVGFFIGNAGEMYKTSDAGRSWQKQDTATSLNLYSVFYLNENLGFVGARSANCNSEDCNKGALLLKTVDGGKSWTKLFFKEYTGIHSITFADELHGLAIGFSDSETPHLIKTLDGGKNWTKLNVPIRATLLDSRIALIDQVIYIKGERQHLLKSTDFGDSWTSLNIPHVSTVSGLQFIDNDTGFVSDYYSIYKTVDGGINWQKTTFQNDKYLTTFRFLNGNEGIVIESVQEYEGIGIAPTFKGTILYHTLNAGQTWAKSSLYKSLWMSSAVFPSSNIGYSVYGLRTYRFKRK